MADPSVTSISYGGVTLTSSSADIGNLLSDIERQLANNASYNYDPETTTVPVPTVVGETLVFTISPTITVNIDSNFGIVITDVSASLSGGGQYTSIFSGADGSLTYTGSAGEVVALGGNSFIDDLLAYAKIAFAGTGNSAVLEGPYSTLTLDNGSTGSFSVTGTGAIIIDGKLNLGNASVAAAVSAADATLAGGMSTFTLTNGNSITLADTVAGDSAYVILNGGANTISAQAGTSTISARRLFTAKVP